MLQHHGAGANHAALAQRDEIPYRGVQTYETPLANRDPTADHTFSGQEAVIPDSRMMAEIIPAQHDHIGSDLRVGLDGVVFEDDAVVTEDYVASNCCFLTDEADELVA